MMLPEQKARTMWRLPVTRMHRHRFMFAALAMALLASCGTPPPTPVFPELTYTHLPPIRLMVSRVDIIDQYVPPTEAPHVGHLFPTPPLTAARRWAQDRLAAAGNRYTARYVIKEASATETPLERTRGLKGAFTTDQTERYDVAIEVLLEIADSRGFSQGYVTARATRARTSAEDITPNARRKLWFDLTEAVMKDLNGELERQINAHMGRFRI
jgi:hypothetical protein